MLQTVLSFWHLMNLISSPDGQLKSQEEQGCEENHNLKHRGEKLMSLNKELAQKLMEKEKYERKILAFKLFDEIPKNVEFYGNDMSMLCAIAAEAWTREEPFYVTKENCVCGGSLYAGIGIRKSSKEEREAGMSILFGEGAPYGSKQ